VHRWTNQTSTWWHVSWRYSTTQGTPMKRTNIQMLLGLRYPRFTEYLDWLLEHRLVEKAPDDDNVERVALTPKGHRFLSQAGGMDKGDDGRDTDLSDQCPADCSAEPRKFRCYPDGVGVCLCIVPSIERHLSHVTPGRLGVTYVNFLAPHRGTLVFSFVQACIVK
jgi:predicted transcriptional regulator